MATVVETMTVGNEEYEIKATLIDEPKQDSPLPITSGAVYDKLSQDRGSTAKEGSVGIFTRHGAFGYFAGCTPAQWAAGVHKATGCNTYTW